MIQSRLAHHMDVCSFPETQFFVKLFRERKGIWRHRLNLVSPNAKRARLRLEELFGDKAVRTHFGRFAITLQGFISSYVSLLDHVAKDASASTWVEKSPLHVLHCEEIAKRVPGAHIVHVVRNGPDVLTSIRARARRWPDQFSNQQSPNYGIRLWNECIAASARVVGTAGHSMVSYERFTASPEAEMRRLCDEIKLSYSPEMLTPPAELSQNLRERHEAWKQRIDEPVRRLESQFEATFDDEEKKSILSQLNQREHTRILEVTYGR